MKTKIKQLLGMSVALAMAAGMIQTSVSAARTGFQCDFNVSDAQVISAKTIDLCGDAPQNLDYPGGLAGRLADDHSARQTFTDAAEKSGFQFKQYASMDDTRGKYERYLYEGSILYSGDADYLTFSMKGINQYYNKNTNFTCAMTDSGTSLSRYFWQGKYFKSYENRINIKKNQWVRFVLDLNTNIKKSNLYVNGQKYTLDIDDYLGYVDTLTFTAGFNNVGDGSKTASIAIDDVKVTLLGKSVSEADYIYEPTGDQATEITCEVNSASGMSYDSATERITYPSGATVKEVIDAITPNSGSVRVIKSYEDSEILSENASIGTGNIAVIVSNDGGTFKYISLVNGDEARIVSYNPMSSTSSFKTFAGEGVEIQTSAEDALYAKGKDDYAFVISSTDKTPGNNTIRSNYLTIDDSMFSLDSFTYEFSVAVEGDVSDVSLINYASTNGIEKFAYNQPVYLANGKMYVNDNGTRKFIRNYRDGEWYRVGITYYPKELKQDIYVNGVKQVSKGWIVNDENDRDPQKYQATSFWFNNIGVTFPGYGHGKVAIDDTLLYTGEHFDSNAYAVDINPDTLSVGKTANDIYVDDLSSMTIAELMEELNISNDVAAVMYVDNTYSQEAEDLVYGNVLILTSKNGLVKEYYTIMPSLLNIDSEITYYVNSKKSASMPTEGAAEIEAFIRAFAPTYQKNVNGTLILAVYSGNKLVKFVSDEKDISSDTLFKVNYTLSDTKGVTVKVFFWDSFNGLKPYVSSKTISSAK